MNALRPTTFLWWLTAIALLGLGSFLRLEGLERRPMHTDEAVQAVKFGELLEQGTYIYDPAEYHGPTLYYAALPIAWAQGKESFATLSERDVRLVPVLFGLLALALILSFRKWLGPAGTLAALALAATATPLVYYSRYFVQEALLVAGALAFLATALRWLENPSARYAIGCGLAVGWMHATKETAVLLFAAFALAVALAWLTHPGKDRWEPLRTWTASWRTLLLALAAAAFLSGIFFSSFGSHLEGPLDSIKAYFHTVDRAGGQGHEKPWGWFWKLLWGHQAIDKRWWTQAPLLVLAAFGSIIAWRRHPQAPARRALVLFPWLLLLIHSFIPYKTPWLVLSPVVGLCLAAGIGVQWMTEKNRWGIGIALAILLGVVSFDTRQSLRANNRIYAAHERNPWAYSHPGMPLLELSSFMEKIAETHEETETLVVKVMAPEVWPLPWYLRKYPQTGFWEVLPKDPKAAPVPHVVITDARWAEDLEGRLGDGYIPSMYGLRPGILLILYTDEILYNTYLENIP